VRVVRGVHDARVPAYVTKLPDKTDHNDNDIANGDRAKRNVYGTRPCQPAGDVAKDSGPRGRAPAFGLPAAAHLLSGMCWAEASIAKPVASSIVVGASCKRLFITRPTLNFTVRLDGTGTLSIVLGFWA